MTLEIQHAQSLQRFNTFGLDVTAEHLAVVRSEDEIRDALTLCDTNGWPLTVLGGGSNVLLSGNVAGLTLIVAVPGIVFEGERVTAGAGEGWHTLVLASIEQGLSGIENLALIPGSVGAAPIQNIGAYGMELDEVFLELRAIDRQTGESVTLNKADCEFGYRDSLFKRNAHDRYIITSVTLRLSRAFQPELSYKELASALEGYSDLTPLIVAETVCEIRRSKLPDPMQTGNAGSFFKNPVVARDLYEQLARDYSGVPHWQQDDGSVKLSAGWLIDQCGYRGKSKGGAAVFDRHALVLVNLGAATPEDVLTLSHEITSAVSARFDIDLDIEPRLF